MNIVGRNNCARLNSVALWPSLFLSLVLSNAMSISAQSLSGRSQDTDLRK